MGVVFMNGKRNFNWKAFEEPKKKFMGVEQIAILDHGGMSFNVTFMRNNFPEEKPKFVKFFHDEDSDNKYIGFQFTDDDKITGVHKVYYPKKEYGIVACVSFFKKYNIDYKNKHKGPHRPEIIQDKDAGKLYVISVRK